MVALKAESGGKTGEIVAASHRYNTWVCWSREMLADPFPA